MNYNLRKGLFSVSTTIRKVTKSLNAGSRRKPKDYAKVVRKRVIRKAPILKLVLLLQIVQAQLF